MKRFVISLSLGMLLAVPASGQVSAVPSLMSYQGRLATPSGNPVPDGNYTIQFSLFNALTGGTLVWQRSIANVPVRNGTFAVRLDFTGGFQNSATLASVFGASAVFLETKIGTDPALTPRQQLVTVAYAMKANSVADSSITTGSILDGTILAADLANGTITGAKIAAGTITADKFAANIFNPLAWLLSGNSGTNPASQFLGTTDNQPLAFKVNNRQAMRYQYAENTAQAGFEYRGINILGGSDINSIRAGVVGATLSGGGFDNFSIIDFPNRVSDEFGTVGGGGGNQAGNDNADLIDARFATVAGGINNSAGRFAATVSGGDSNVASGDYSVVGGGFGNTASGGGATVAGGRANAAVGVTSFAAGRRAKANHDGAFVWGDGTDADFASTANNQFLIRASGNVGINKNNPAAALDVNGSAFMTGFRLSTGATTGRTLLSDASGNGTWGQLGTAGIADNAVTGAKIANGTITADKIASAALGWFLNGNAISDPATQFLGTTTNQPLVFRTNNTEKLRLAANGNLGIGTNDPLTKLHIQDGTLRFGIAADAKNYEFAYDSDGDYFYIDEFGVGRHLVIKNGGNIGIGTVNPGRRLQVGDSTSNSVGIIRVGQKDNFTARAWDFGIGDATLFGHRDNFGFKDNAGNTILTLQSSGQGGKALFTGSGEFGGGINVVGAAYFLSGSVTVANSLVGGNLGIKTETPDRPLTIQAAPAELQWLSLKNNAGVTKWHLNHDSGGLNFVETDIADNRLFLAAGGNVGIGTGSPSHKFTVQGGANSLRLIGSNSFGHGAILSFGDANIVRLEEFEDDKLKIAAGTVRVEGTFVNASDARYKQNIAPLDNALDAILNLRGVSYDWKPEFMQSKHPQGKQIGFIAQELETVLPELVHTDKDGYKAVAYLGVIPVLVEAVKTLNARTVLQQKQNDALKTENDTLKATLAEVMRRLNALENSRK